MNLNDIIDNILRIPIVFHEIRNKSAYTLLKESGYFEEFDSIDEMKIYNRLVKQPHLVEHWLLWSDDERAMPTYSLEIIKEGKYIVNYRSNIDGKYEKKTIFETGNIFHACAIYIKRHLEYIRLIKREII